MKNYLRTLLKALLGIITPTVVPIYWARGEVIKLLTHEDMQKMRESWQRVLAERAGDPALAAVLEIIEYRITQASAAVQSLENHRVPGGEVSYRAGEAGGLSDLMLEVVRMMHPAK